MKFLKLLKFFEISKKLENSENFGIYKNLENPENFDNSNM